MPQRSIHLEGVGALPEATARNVVGSLHDYLRECILDGRIPPDTVLSQAALAKQLGVSRTPLREVLRMLQEEGLVASEPNQRMRVAGFDAEDLDATYGTRIVLESLAVAMTVEGFSLEQHRAGGAALEDMRACANRRDLPGWFDAHTRFHGILHSGAPELLGSQLRSLADRSARYIRAGQRLDPTGWDPERDREHAELLAALASHDPRSVPLAAAHLQHTAIQVLSSLAPDFVPRAVPIAVAQAHAERTASAAPADR